MRGPLRVEVAPGRAIEQHGEHHLGEKLALQIRLRLGRLGQPSLDVGDAAIGDHIPSAFGPGPLLNRPGHRLPVPGQPGQRGVHLAVPHLLPAAEVHVVVALQVVAVARPALEQAQQCQRNAHIRENTPRVFSRKVVRLKNVPDSLDPVLDTVVDFTDRGFPSAGVSAGVRLRDVGAQGWHALRPPMSLPLLLLKRAALDNNLDAMSRYCAANQLLLAPHGKTHMSPQLWREQESHGAWAVTVASAHQAEVYRRFGARRILIANELVSAADLGWLAAVRAADPGCELLLVVDSPAAAERVAAALTPVPAPVPQPVLIEVGYPDGRAGARDL